MTPVDEIKSLLSQKINVAYLAVEDDSRFHAGHALNKHADGGHFRLVVVSEDFEGKSRIERHRMIYAVLDGMKNGFHALGIQTYTDKEWRRERETSG